MLKPQSKKAVLIELDFLRALGILAVLFIHATSSAVASTDPNSSLFLIFVFINTLSKFAVPLFILISGFSLFYNYYDYPLNKKSIRTFYKKRFLKILSPFIIFSFVYYTVVILSRYEWSSFGQFISHFFTWDFLIKLIIGKTYTHLYFVFVIIQCYLVFPFVLYLLQKNPRLIKWIVAGGLVVQWIYLLYAKEIGIPYVKSGFFAYIFYFFIGAYLGINYNHVQQFWNLKPRRLLVNMLFWSAFVLSGAVNIVYFVYEAQGKEIFSHLFWVELKNELYITSACFMMLSLALWIKRSQLRRSKSILIQLSYASFGIYLIHPLFLKLYRMANASGNSLTYGAWIAGGFLFALFGSWFIVLLAGKWKGHWILFGPIPKRKF